MPIGCALKDRSFPRKAFWRSGCRRSGNRLERSVAAARLLCCFGCAHLHIHEAWDVITL
jgi:hypothetical protein